MSAKNDVQGPLVPHRGVCFKQTPEGGFSEIPYCPNCFTEMVVASYVAPFLCPRCRTVSKFNVSQLGKVHRELVDGRCSP